MNNISELRDGNIVVTGATGFVGRHLVERLLKDNLRIEVVTRNKESVPSAWYDRVSIIETDIATGDYEWSADTKLVFHCAGETADPKEFNKTNILGTQKVLEESVRSGAKRIVYLSSVGVMGKEKPGIFDENVKCTPRNDYEKSKCEGERLVLNAAASGEMTAAIVRPGIIYGPGKSLEKDSFLALLRSIRDGYFRYIGSGRGVYNIVYIGDVVEALFCVAFKPIIKGQETFIVNNHMLWKDFIVYVQSLLCEERKIGRIPFMVAFSMALGCELAGIFGKNLPFSVSRYKALTSRTIFSAEHIKKEMHFEFLSGNHKGIKDTVEYYQKNELL